MRRIIIALALATFAASPALASSSCKDAKGKYTKCPPAAAPTSTSASSSASVTKDAKGKCHVASGPKKGQYTKCP
jgi:hypothetical protein